MALEGNLQQNEETLRTFSPSRLYWWLYYLAAVICFFTIIGIPLTAILIVYAELSRYRVRYLLTSKRVVKETGILGRHTISIPYSRITDLETHQTFFQRILSIGDIVVNTAGGQGPEMIMRGISRAMDIKMLIEENVSKGRQ